jgi:hypothetical protein
VTISFRHKVNVTLCTMARISNAIGLDIYLFLIILIAYVLDVWNEIHSAS